MITFKIITPVFLLEAIDLIIIFLINIYKRKNFTHIKNNGDYFEGIIISANYHSNGAYGKYRWLSKKSGDITVSANNQTYTITNIDYNEDFKLFEQKLNENFYTNKQKIINIDRYFKNTGILNKINCKEITIGIYVLDNKAVADLNTIKGN